jgi:hypothetical protein
MADKHDRSKPHRHELPQHPSAEFEFFPTSKRKAIQSRSPNLFVSAKAATAIPTRHPALQDALIQASLDPAVRSIDYIATAAVGSEQVNLGAIVVQRDDGRFLLDVVPARHIRDLEDEGLSLIALGELGLKTLVITAKELRREPRCTNARFVWLYNQQRVSRELRKRILRVLRDKESLQLGELERSVRSDRDPSNDVMALVCAGELELDLISQPIQQTTIVKSRMK